QLLQGLGRGGIDAWPADTGVARRGRRGCYGIVALPVGHEGKNILARLRPALRLRQVAYRDLLTDKSFGLVGVRPVNCFDGYFLSRATVRLVNLGNDIQAGDQELGSRQDNRMR